MRRLVVEAGDLNPPGAVADTRKRLHEPPGGIRRNALERGVCVGRERLDVEANAQRSLVAERALRPTVGQPRGVALPQRAVGVEQFDVAADDLVEARAADFFFALDDPPNPDGEFAGVGADRADRRESHCKLALIVRRAACEQLAVALCWLERRRFPEVERIDGLDVVMVIEQECEIAAARLVGVDSRRPTDGAKLARLEAIAREQLFDETGGLVERPILRGDARRAAKYLEMRRASCVIRS